MPTRRESLGAVGAGCFSREAERIKLFAELQNVEQAHGVCLTAASVKVTGFFDQELLTCIAESPSFLLVLSPHALDRCSQPGDYLQHEIAHAVTSKLNAIPVFAPGFAPPQQLTEEAGVALAHQGVHYDHRFFRHMVDDIFQNVDDEAARREQQQRLKEEQNAG